MLSIDSKKYKYKNLRRFLALFLAFLFVVAINFYFMGSIWAGFLLPIILSSALLSQTIGEHRVYVVKFGWVFAIIVLLGGCIFIYSNL